MTEPSQSKFVTITNQLSAWLPLIGLINLFLALTIYGLGYGNNVVLYVVAALMMLAGIPIVLRLTFGQKGMRSIETAGFKRNRDAWFFANSLKGYDWKPIAIAIASLVMLPLLGLGSKPPIGSELLAFTTAWSLTGVAHLTRRWPADDP